VSWLAFEFWQQRLLGSVQGQLRMVVPAESVALVALRTDRGVPQVISTSRHFTQGGVELRDVNWSADSNALSGISLGGIGTRHNVIIRIPAGYQLDLDEPELPHDFSGYSLSVLPNGLARLHVHFDSKDEVPWNLKFNRV